MNNASVGKSLTIAAILAVMLWLGTTAQSQQPRPQPTNAILGLLKKGQAISVKDAGFNYELTAFADGPETLSHTVIEITPDYVLVRNLAGVIDTAIPLWSIKAISTVRLGAK